MPARAGRPSPPGPRSAPPESPWQAERPASRRWSRHPRRAGPGRTRERRRIHAPRASSAARHLPPRPRRRSPRGRDPPARPRGCHRGREGRAQPRRGRPAQEGEIGAGLIGGPPIGNEAGMQLGGQHRTATGAEARIQRQDPIGTSLDEAMGCGEHEIGSDKHAGAEGRPPRSSATTPRRRPAGSVSASPPTMAAAGAGARTAIMVAAIIVAARKVRASGQGEPAAGRPPLTRCARAPCAEARSGPRARRRSRP